MPVKNLKIFHTADIQIEVRNSAQRYDEFEYMLNLMVQSISKECPDIVVIAGDITEFCTPNATEIKLFIDFLDDIHEIDSVKEIVVIKGNHDIQQRSSLNWFVKCEQKATVPDVLDTILESVNIPELLYCPKSLFYHSNVFDGFGYLVWSQKHKFEVESSDGEQLQYNPKENCKVPEGYEYITLFHDCIKNAVNFDGKAVRNSGTKPDCEDLGFTGLVLAGDIHQHSVIDKSEYKFTYCGSPVPRDFGEGSYFHNGTIIQNGMANHGYNIVCLNSPNSIDDISICWKPLYQYASFLTFTFDGQFSDVNSIIIPETCKGLKKNRVRIRILNEYDKLLSMSEQIVAKIKSQLENAEFVIESGKDLQSQGLATTDIEVEKLISIDKIKEVAKEYIAAKVKSSRSIPSIDKDLVKNEIYNTFVDELEKFKHNDKVFNIIPLEMKLSNFLALGDDIKIQFNNGLTKISGTNGIGKTTLYSGIKWLWTGYIDPNQASNKKKENRLIVFNDNRPHVDKVQGTFKLLVNGNELTIRRCIERYWKKDVTEDEKKSENWQDYCEMPNEILKVEYLDHEYSDDRAADLLYEFFGSLSNLCRTMFATAPSLYSIINTGTQSLNNEILFNLGLNFFEPMLDAYDSIRDKKFENLVKPSKTPEEYDVIIDEYNQNLGEIQANIAEINEAINNFSETSHSQNVKIIALNKEIDFDAETKYKQTEVDIENESRELFSTRTSLEKEFEKLTDSIRFLESQKFDDKVVELGKVNTDKQFEIDKYSVELANIETKIGTRNLKIEQRKNELINSMRDSVDEYKEKRNELTKRISIECDSTISNLRNDIEKLKTEEKLKHSETSKYYSDKKHTIGLETQNLGNNYRENETLINITTKEIENLRKKIESHLEQRVCPTCKRELDKESLEHISEIVKSIEQEIAEKNAAISTLTDNNKSINAQISELNAKIFAIVSEEDAKHSEITDKNKEHISKIESEIDKIDKELRSKLQSYIDSINSKLDSLKQELIAKLENDSEIVTNTAKIKEYGAMSKELKDKVEVLKQDIKTNLKEIEQCNEKLSTIVDLKNDLALNQEKTKSLKVKEQDIENKRLQLDALSKVIEHNKELQVQIIECENLKKEADGNYHLKHDALIKVTAYKSEIETNIKNAIDDKENALKYRRVDSSMRIYKVILGKNGLPIYIFSLIRNPLNEALNESLKELPFKIFFNEDNELKMITNSGVIRNVSRTSGMESTFAGLSLIRVLKTKNVTNKNSILFIDEISGSLNDGKDLSYEATDFQESLKKLLHVMKQDFNIFIVDHVIHDMGEDTRYEVIKSDDGNQVVWLK